MKNKENKKRGKKSEELPTESESEKLQREIDEVIAEMESGVDRLRNRFRKMQEQLGELHRHLYPDDEEKDSQSEAITWKPGQGGKALLA